MEETIEMNLVINMLELTFRAGKDKDRSSAEVQLNKLANNPLEMIKVLLKIISSEQTNELIKESASNFLIKMLRGKKITSEVFTLESKSHALSQIIPILSIDFISYKIKCNLKESMTILLQDDEGLGSILREKTVQMLVDAYSSNKISDYLKGFIITQALLNAITKFSDIKKLFIDTIPFLNSIVAKLLVLYVDYMKKAIENLSNDPSQMKLIKIPREGVILYDAILSWIEIIEIFANKIYELKSESMELLCCNQNLTHVFHEILSLTIHVGTQIFECVFSTTGVQFLDDHLNNFKKLILGIFNVIVCHSLKKYQANIKYINSVFFKILLERLPTLIISMVRVFKAGKYNNVSLQNKNIALALKSSFSLIHSSITSLEMYPAFANNKDLIITELVFLCLRANSDELNLINNDPEEFFHLSLDTCEKQTSETFKTACAKIIEAMSDHIDGSLSFISNLTLSAISYSIESNNLNEINLKYKHLMTYNNWEFLVSTSPEIRIDTCLVILSILNYSISKRKDIIKEIENLLIQHYDFFTSDQLTKLLQSRICLFLGYYLEDVFVSKDMNILQQNYFSKYFFYIVNFLKLSFQIDPVALQALDSIDHILKNKENLELIKIIINDAFSNFVTLTRTTQISQLFDLIQELLNDYFLYLKNKEEFLNNLLICLRDRIFDEMNKIKGSSNTSNIFINKSWNIIRSLSENKYFLVDYINIMETDLYQLFELLKDPNQIDFDEDILLLIAEFIKKSKRISTLERSLFQYFGLYFEKYHFVFGNLFATLNYYIFYGSDFLANDSQCLALIIEIGLQALFSNNKYTNEANQSQGLLILQQLLLNHSKLLSGEQKSRIITKSIERGYQNIQKDFLKCHLNEIFICFFLTDFAFIQDFLLKTSQLDPVITSILDKPQIYHHNYDKKLFVFGMSAVLLQEVSPTIYNTLPKLLQTLIFILKLDAKSKKGKLALKRRDNLNSEKVSEVEEEPVNNEPIEERKDSKDSIENNWENSSDEEEYDDYFDEIDFNEENEINTMLNYLVSPILTEDEYQYFRQTITKLKEGNIALLQNLILNLSNIDKVALNDILLCQKITFDLPENKIENKAFRKIVKVKKI